MGNNCWNTSAGLPFGTTLLGGEIGSAEDMQMPSATIGSATCGALASAGVATMLSGNFLLCMLSVAQPIELVFFVWNDRCRLRDIYPYRSASCVRAVSTEWERCDWYLTCVLCVQ